MIGIKEFSALYASEQDLSVREGERVVKSVVSLLSDCLMTRGIQFVGHFTIKRVIRAPKIGRDMIAKKEVSIPQRVDFKFSMGKLLKDRVNATT